MQLHDNEVVMATGPRQPWHDIHCQLQGPVATDVLVNFVQRWLKQAADKKDKLLPLMEVSLWPSVRTAFLQVNFATNSRYSMFSQVHPSGWQLKFPITAGLAALWVCAQGVCETIQLNNFGHAATHSFL